MFVAAEMLLELQWCVQCIGYFILTDVVFSGL